MSKFFIDRPIFAWVIAILIILGGTLSIFGVGVQSYPDIAPPEVSIVANYPGASADTAEGSVTKVIEQQLTGIDNLLYFSSQTSRTGRISINLSFATGTNPDIAAVQVQNQVQRAMPRLPTEVVQQGVTVQKTNPDIVMAVGVKSDNPAIGRDRLNDIVASQVLDPISRVRGVGQTRQFGAEYAMRIWLNPQKLQAYGLSATDVLNAVRAQNIQFAAGSLGADPATKGWGFTANVVGPGRFSTPEQFRNVILRANSDGTTVKLGDVAKVEYGPENYGFNVQYDGKGIAAFAVQLAPGANALTVKKEVVQQLDKLQASFPQGVSWFIPYDTTTYVTTSIHEVVDTLIEAIGLVVLVMLLFLQNIRATIIPAIIIPIALLGGFIGMNVLGFTINQLTMFGMVLAIGIVVDDAIVVIENIQRIMDEEHLQPKEAARKGMGEISGAVVAITAVLTAVFVPSALQPGATGIIYRQFALTIAVSMLFSAFLALTFTPALCGSFLKPHNPDKKPNFISRWFNKLFDRTQNTYVRHTRAVVNHSGRWMLVFAVVAVLAGFLYTKLPGSFLPEEDQGYVMAMVELPNGATKDRTDEVMAQMRAVLKKNPAFKNIMQVTGFSFQGSGENTGMAFIQLKDWEHRSVTAPQFIQQANAALHKDIPDATIFVVNLPTVKGLGQFGGFDMFLEDRSGGDRSVLASGEQTVLKKAAQDKVLSAVHPNQLPPSPELKLSVDRVQAASMGVSIGDVSNAINLMLAPVYVNDFFTEGRVKRVMMQAEAPYRMDTKAFDHFYTPSSTQKQANGLPAMIPISNVLHEKWALADPSLKRFNGFPAVEIVGNAAPGYASGQAMDAIQNIVKSLPSGFGLDWTGQSYQEVLSGNAAAELMALSILVVFLALAALYESWSVPIAVLLIVPLTLLGTVLFTLGRGLADDVFFKIGLVTVIGLAAKNAILIIEFAVDAQKQGESLREGVIKAAHLRFRPILMTSLAFILGVLPLAIASGPGANARHAIGTGVIGGMVFATFFGLMLIPVFYVIVRRVAGDKMDSRKGKVDTDPFGTGAASADDKTLPPPGNT